MKRYTHRILFDFMPSSSLQHCYLQSQRPNSRFSIEPKIQFAINQNEMNVSVVYFFSRVFVVVVVAFECYAVKNYSGLHLVK